MCWKRELPDSEPSSPMPFEFFTDSTSQNVTEGGVSCPATGFACNATRPGQICHHGGILCCVGAEEPVCSCPSGWKEPTCLEHDYEDPLSSVYSHSSSLTFPIVITLFIVGVIVLIVIVALVIRRRRRRNQSPNATCDSVTLQQLPSKHDLEGTICNESSVDYPEKQPINRTDANGNNNGGS